jgi:hypothetical protein
LADEKEFPIFKSEGEAFDRAKINQEVNSGNTGAITREIGDAMRDADSVSKEAKKFYDQSFNEDIKALDPAYDPNSIYYTSAYSNQGSDKKNIEKRIEKGEAVDGKEIVDMAQKAAYNKVENAKVLKTGTVTKIVENIGARQIKDMEAFEDVKSEFDSKIKSEKYNFDKLFSSLYSILNEINNPGPTGVPSGVFTPENNAIISALAKILEKEGFDSESVKAMSAKYDENTTKLTEKVGGSIEKAGEEKKTEEKKSEAGVTGAEQKLESKNENAASATGATGAAIESAPKTTAESPVEGAKTEVGETKVGENATGASATGAQSQLLNKEGGTGDKSGATGIEGSKNESEMIRGSQAGADFLKEMFGGILGLSEAGGTGEAQKLESRGVELAKGIVGDKSETGSTGGSTGGGPEKLESKTEIKTETKAGENKEGPKSIESNNTSITSDKTGSNNPTNPENVSTVEKIQEKVGASPETFAKSEGIKETVTQKLSSSISPEKVSNEKPNQPTTSTVGEDNSSQAKTENSTTQEGGAGTEKKEEPSKSGESEGSNSMEELSKKMEAMVGLLSQLNDTLSGPLLVTPTTKKFD